MKEHRWILRVRDERGRRRRGAVSFGDLPPSEAPSLPDEFHIALLSAAIPLASAPAATAICVPRLARDGASRHAPAPDLHGEIADWKRGRMSDERRAQYAAGSIVLPAGAVEAASVFSRSRNEIRLEALALTLTDMLDAELLAPYVAVIRHELRLPPGANALLELETRLAPADPEERPPARAPGIVRLRRAAQRLRGHAPPEDTLDGITEDLRFLRLFGRQDHVLRSDALDRLLADVTHDQGPANLPRRARAPIPKVRPRGDA